MKWTKGEKEYMKKMYSTGSKKELMETLKRNWASILYRAYLMGLVRGKGEWNEEEKKMLVELYPFEKRDVICSKINRTWQAIKDQAYRMGIKRKGGKKQSDLFSIENLDGHKF